MNKYNNKYIEGKPGRDGRDGKMGSQGLKGEQGLRGYTGLPGLRGEPSIRGIEGIQGLPGEKGEKGTKGEKGEKGCIGPMGNSGIRGPQGMRGEYGGPSGPQGIPGPAGPISENFKQQFNFFFNKKISWDGVSIADFSNVWLNTDLNDITGLSQSKIEEMNFFPSLSIPYEKLFLKNASLFSSAFIIGNIQKITNKSGIIFNNTFKMDINLEYITNGNKLNIQFVPTATDFILELNNVNELILNLDGSDIIFNSNQSNLQVINNILILDLENIPTIVNKSLIFSIQEFNIKIKNQQLNWEKIYTNDDGFLNFTWNNYENKVIKYEWVNEDNLEFIIYNHCGYETKTQEIVQFDITNSNVICTHKNLIKNLEIGYKNNINLSVKINKIKLKNLNNINLDLNKFSELFIYLKLNLSVLGQN